VQVREKHLSEPELADFAREVVSICQPYGARVLVNADIEMAHEVGADGVHLSSARLGAMNARPEGLLCAASCHTAEELARAEALGLDFVLLSAVMATLSHPLALPLGWEKFAAMITDYSLPVYALGGMRPDSLDDAWAHGAHGIAMQRAVWS
jgi:8-oxo-dGTP diphosphatase